MSVWKPNEKLPIFAFLISHSKHTVFHHQMKHFEVSQKYSAARRIFNSLLSVSSGGETMRLILDILLHVLALLVGGDLDTCSYPTGQTFTFVAEGKDSSCLCPKHESESNNTKCIKMTVITTNNTLASQNNLNLNLGEKNTDK